MVILALSTTGCGSTNVSATEEAICGVLGAHLPTWSTQDTEQSKREGAKFLDVFDEVCPGAKEKSPGG